jgi:hypothetical protein
MAVVQEILKGIIEKDNATLYGVSFTFLLQGLSSGYNLDTFFAKISADGNELSGKCTDSEQHDGTFTLSRKKE